MQVRLGLNETEQQRASGGRGGGKYEFYDDRGGMGLSTVYVQCGYSYLLHHERASSLAWLLVVSFPPLSSFSCKIMAG